MSLNEFQRLEDEILYCEKVIAWRAERIKALTFLRKKDEVEKENDAVKLENEQIVKLKKEKQTIIFKFENVVPKTKDITIASVEELRCFDNATSGIMPILLHNPKCCKINHECNIFFVCQFFCCTKRQLCFSRTIL